MEFGKSRFLRATSSNFVPFISQTQTFPFLVSCKLHFACGLWAFGTFSGFSSNYRLSTNLRYIFNLKKLAENSQRTLPNHRYSTSAKYLLLENFVLACLLHLKGCWVEKLDGPTATSPCCSYQCQRLLLDLEPYVFWDIRIVAIVTSGFVSTVRGHLLCILVMLNS